MYRRLVVTWLLMAAWPSLRAGELAIFDAQSVRFRDALTLTCLQGLVNRDAPRLCLAFRATDGQWAAYVARELGLKLVRVTSRDELLRRFRPQLKGYVVWDPAAVHTANLAATVAGLDDCLVVAPDGEAAAKSLGLECRRDFRGQFAAKAPAEVYAWAGEHLWPRCSREVIGFVSAPTRPEVFDVTPLLAETGYLYLRFEDAVPADAHGARVHRLRLEWDGARAIEFRAGSYQEVPYLLDPGTGHLDGQGDRAADGAQYWLYRFRLPRGAKGRLRLDVHGQYHVRAAGRAGSTYKTLARSTQATRRANNQIRDFLVARRAIAIGLPPQADLTRRLLRQAKPGALVLGWSGPQLKGLDAPAIATANLSLHQPVDPSFDLRARAGIRPQGLAVPFSTHEAAGLQFRTGVESADPEATSTRVRVARPGKDKANLHFIYGPYEAVPAGRYLVAWRVKAVGKLTDARLATFDVVDVRAAKAFAERTVKGSELTPAGRYQWVVLPIVLGGPGRLEYRILWHGGAELRADRVVVWRTSQAP